jgi:hypothetical protein
MQANAEFFTFNPNNHLHRKEEQQRSFTQGNTVELGVAYRNSSYNRKFKARVTLIYISAYTSFTHT